MRKKGSLGNPFAAGSIPADIKDFLQRVATQTLGY
jgi:hypothetical protein